jgi:hypothetical protein
MDAMNRVAFRIEEYDAGHTRCQCAVPFVDGVSILSLVTDFESSKGWDLAGAYAGIAPGFVDASRWVRSLLGVGHPEYEGDGITWLLGCTCTVAGCWPLEARVTIDATTVTWESFRQPFRPERDYSDFGPFTFDRREYEAAIAELAKSLSIDLAADDATSRSQA